MTTNRIDQARHSVQPIARSSAVMPANRDRDILSSGRDTSARPGDAVRPLPLAPVGRRQSSARGRTGIGTLPAETADWLIESYVCPPPEDMSLAAGPTCLGLLEAIVAEAVRAPDRLPEDAAAVLTAELDQRRDLISRLYVIGGVA